MKKIIFLMLCVLLSGCAHVSRRADEGTSCKESFIEMNKFCKQHKLVSVFDTIDDVVRLESGDKDIRLLLNSLIVYCNGTTFYLKKTPYYEAGRIFIPGELSVFLASALPSKRGAPVCIKTVVIDPGHGGKDPGAISRKGVKEKDVNLKISRLLKKQLESKGFKVHLTRSTDVFLTLRQRVEIAKERDADLFISVHANANRNRKVNGVEVYYLAPKYFNSEARAIALAENSSLNIQGKFSKNTRAIVWDLICTENNAASLEFSSLLTRSFKKLGFKVKPPRGAPFYVLKNAYVPSVLVEAGYLSNSYEEKLLVNQRYQKQVAEAIALGVSAYNKGSVQVVKKYGSIR